VIERLVRREIDPIMRHEEIVRAFEVLCDAPGGDPAKAFRAVLGIQDRYRRPERWEAQNPSSDAIRIACGITLAAEVAHRCERYRQAVVFCLTAFGYLETAAGGSRNLTRLVASARPGALAEAATAVRGIWPAPLRRASYPPQAKAELRRRAPDLVPALLASDRVYPRTHAFATQEFFDRVELADERDLDRLFALSNETRADNLRSWATAPLVSLEYARARGDQDAVIRESALARERIEAFALPRHLDRVTRFGYLAA
jgi:hypothetical protein